MLSLSNSNFLIQTNRAAKKIGFNPWSKADKDDANQERDLTLLLDLTKAAQQIAQS